MNRLNDNNRNIDSHRENINKLEALAKREQEIIDSLGPLSEKLMPLLQKYDETYNNTERALNKVTEIGSHLLKLKEDINAQESHVTRDNCLQTILTILNIDHPVFSTTPVVGNAKDKIKSLINNELGAGAVEKVMTSTVVESPNGPRLSKL